MGERLAAGNAAIALLANSIATGCGLFVLILIAAPVSGAHFNPAVTAVVAWGGGLAWRNAQWYIIVQLVGGVAGVLIAHTMFAAPILQLSAKVRTGLGQWLAEAVATFGLVTVIIGCKRYDVKTTALAIAAYITAAYWFTASTSFANPAVTIARSMTDTFAGVHPANVLMFIVSQLVGAGVAVAAAHLVQPEGEHF